MAASLSAEAQGVPKTTHHGRLTVEVVGLRSVAGQVVVSVYRTAEGFPGKVDAAFRRKVASIESFEVREAHATPEFTEVGIHAKPVSLEFVDLPPGQYAVVVFHDENNNLKLDSGLLGIPAEGYGASNNNLPALTPPTFERSRFTFTNPGQALSIQIKYLL